MSESAFARHLRKVMYDLRERVPMLTVYDHPTDFPHGVIARLWVTLPRAEPYDIAVTARNIEDLQLLLMEVGLTRLERAAEDDPVIMETWL